jgi:Kef-type K+ transport system membrane component KefB
MGFHIPSLLVVLAASAAAPIFGEVTRRFGLSIVVIELLLGIVIGQQGLGWAAPEGAIPFLATIGMAFLFFLAGLEIDLDAIKGKPLRSAGSGWLASLAIAMAFALVLREAGLVVAWTVIGLALATTALGVLVPMLRDAGMLETPLGRHVMAAGAVGEVGPILLMPIVLSQNHGVDVQSMLIFSFVTIVLGVAWVILRGVKVPAFLTLLRRTMTQSSQLPIRIVVLLIGALAVLAENFGVDLVLGALAAGMLVKLATRDAENHLLHQKLDAVGFGFVMPIFFVTSGMKFDLTATFGTKEGHALTFIVLAGLPLTRVPIVLLNMGAYGVRGATAVGLFYATALSLIVALTQIAASSGIMRASEASRI